MSSWDPVTPPLDRWPPYGLPWLTGTPHSRLGWCRVLLGPTDSPTSFLRIYQISSKSPRKMVYPFWHMDAMTSAYTHYWGSLPPMLNQSPGLSGWCCWQSTRMEWYTSYNFFLRGIYVSTRWLFVFLGDLPETGLHPVVEIRVEVFEITELLCLIERLE